MLSTLRAGGQPRRVVVQNNPLCLGLNIALPRVDDANTARLEIALVSRHDVQAVTESGRSEEAIGRGNDDPLLLSTSRQFTPELRGLDIETDDSVGELALQDGKPRSVSVSLLASGEKADAPGDFSEREDTHMELSIGNRLHGGHDRRIRRGLSKLRERAGVEKSFQSSISRIGLLSRSRSSPSSDGPVMRKSLKL